MRFVWDNCCECEVCSLQIINTIIYYGKSSIQSGWYLHTDTHTHKANLRNFRICSVCWLFNFLIPCAFIIHFFSCCNTICLFVEIFVRNVLFISRWPKCKTSIKHVCTVLTAMYWHKQSIESDWMVPMYTNNKYIYYYTIVSRIIWPKTQIHTMFELEKYSIMQAYSFCVTIQCYTMPETRDIVKESRAQTTITHVYVCDHTSNSSNRH